VTHPSATPANDEAKESAKKAQRRRDLFIAPVCEGGLLLVVSVAGWVSHQPLIFASLGPTAYELVETPKRQSARPYNIIIGHLIGILAGFAALYLTGARWVPPVSASGVPLARIWSAVVAAALTVVVTLLVRATQPAALSTTLLVSLGIMQLWKDGIVILCAVLLMTLLGEPLRNWREKTMPEDTGK
jgi:hypothetical protein